MRGRVNSIHISDIDKRFGDKQVFKGFSAEIKGGEITCIMGDSGCGKTTLLLILMGLTKPDAGAIQGLPGKPYGVLFQEDRLCEGFSAVENIRVVCRKGISNGVIEAELKKVGLGDSLFVPVSTLSGGMKRRVALVRALLSPSRLVLLDEPFKGLDKQLHREMSTYVKSSLKGRTGIVVTHEREDVNWLAANLVQLKQA